MVIFKRTFNNLDALYLYLRVIYSSQVEGFCLMVTIISNIIFHLIENEDELEPLIHNTSEFGFQKFDNESNILSLVCLWNLE